MSLDPRSFSEQWQDRVLDKYPSINQPLLEKTIYAFELLSWLVDQDFDFIFKGGTSLLLLLSDVNRLSIDIDITGSIDSELLNTIPSDTEFIGIEEDIRDQGKSGVPKRHFEVYYDSRWKKEEDYVLLDVVDDRPEFPQTESVLIESEFFQVDEKQTVTVPTREGLIGDKLTALAPTTIGIPYGTGREVSIVKQLFDLGMLFRESTSVRDAYQSYINQHSKQNRYRNTSYTVKRTLKDALDVCELVSHYRLEEVPDTDSFQELDRGVDGLENHLLWENFKQHEATVIASRVALIVSLLMSESFDRSFRDFEYNEDVIENVTIEGEYDHLNHLLKREPRAFYYWYQATQLLNQLPGE